MQGFTGLLVLSLVLPVTSGQREALPLEFVSKELFEAKDGKRAVHLNLRNNSGRPITAFIIRLMIGTNNGRQVYVREHTDYLDMFAYESDGLVWRPDDALNVRIPMARNGPSGLISDFSVVTVDVEGLVYETGKVERINETVLELFERRRADYEQACSLGQYLDALNVARLGPGEAREILEDEMARLALEPGSPFRGPRLLGKSSRLNRDAERRAYALLTAVNARQGNEIVQALADLREQLILSCQLGVVDTVATEVGGKP